MATPRLIATNLRRHYPSLLRHLHLLNLNTTATTTTSQLLPPTFTSSPFLVLPTTSFRCFCHFPSDSDCTHELNSVTESELHDLGFTDGADFAYSGGGDLLEDSILPIRTVVSLLDGYHDFSGFPWWVIIASSTLAIRITLLPWLILQLQKLTQIAEAMPKLPPPFPPPFSGKSFVGQFSHFRRERQALGCPSFLWFLASYTVQVPCFLLLMTSIRRMSLDCYPGFDTGGILWFHNLTELPSGVCGPILPILIAGLHFCIVQVSFRSASVGNATGLLNLLAKYYRKYLELLTLPLLFIGFCIPQGSHVYWVTNSSLTLIQLLSLQHPTVRQKLGLPTKESLQVAENAKTSKIDTSGSGQPDTPSKQKLFSAFSLSSRELVNLSVAYLAEGKKERSIPLLRLALDKDPECFKAWTILGQTKFQEGLYDEATEYLDHAISKISLLERPIDGEAVDFLIQAHLLSGTSLYKQGKRDEALVHFEKVRDMEEPDDQVAKGRYYEVLMVLSSVFFTEGREDEAAQCLHKAVAYNPQYAIYLKSLGINKDDFVGDLVSSRRGDY